MKLIKPVLWTVFGVVIGSVAVLTASRIEAQATPATLPSTVKAERMKITPAWATDTGGAFGLFVVKDNKSGGCWIATKDGHRWSGIADAPPSACE